MFSDENFKKPRTDSVDFPLASYQVVSHKNSSISAVRHKLIISYWREDSEQNWYFIFLYNQSGLCAMITFITFCISRNWLWNDRRRNIVNRNNVMWWSSSSDTLIIIYVRHDLLFDRWRDFSQFFQWTMIECVCVGVVWFFSLTILKSACIFSRLLLSIFDQ